MEIVSPAITLNRVDFPTFGLPTMASLIYELSVEFEGINITVVPGITAAISGSAVLGAAVSHDFAGRYHHYICLRTILYSSSDW